MAGKTYEEILGATAAADERVVVMTAENRAAIRNLPSKLGLRFIDVGIAEMTMVGAAAGLALRGRRPVVHALATFLTMRAFEFIRTDVGIPGLPVKLVGGVPGFLSDGNGPTHQALEDIALMRGIPGMQVFSPADGEDLAACLPSILASDAPCYIRYNALPPAVPHAPYVPGKAEMIVDGKDVTVLVHGFLLREVMRARPALDAEGISARVVNMRTLSPVDTSAIIQAADETSLLVTVEDHFMTGGLATIVAETLQRAGKRARIDTVALDRWFTPGLLDDVLEHEGFSGPRLARRITNAFRHTTQA
ncbi:MAG TPA: transketolase C-terminal domain-containing protein [Bacteroidota bacterium]|nr:transketolase C-terminal domain-containing protein [Bacteroidota bacterium]